MRRAAALAVLFGAGVLVSRQAAWAQGPTVVQINCGANSYTPAGWEDDDAYVDVGADFANWPTPVDATGVTNAAPDDVYKSVRHIPPHTYTIPVASNGPYIVRMHFCDGYQEGQVRHAKYTIEGVVVESDFDYATAGGFAKAVVRDYNVDVSDGDIVILCEGVGGSDAFEAGIEIILAEPPELDSVTVTPDIAYVRPNEAVELTATSLDQYGDPFVAVVDWVVSGGGTLSSATGDTTTFTSDGTEGTFTVTASADGFSDTASVYVADPELTTITVTPATATIPLVAGAVDLTARALDQFGNPVAVAIVWMVNPAGPMVTPDTGTTDPVTGLLTTTFDSDGSTEDTFTVTATSGAVSGTATVTVTDQPSVASLTLSAPTYVLDNQGAPLTWTVLAKDQFGDSISLVDVAFSIDPVGGTFSPTADITDANGIASTDFTPDGTSTGDFTVTASSGGVQATKTLRITGAPVLTSIEVTPATAAIATGGSVTLGAQPLDQLGNLYATQVTWTVDSVDATLSTTTGGSTVFTSDTEGTYQVTATAGTDPDTVSDTATIAVSPPVLTWVFVTPDWATIPVNGTGDFAAECLNQSGVPMAATVSWSVDTGGTLDPATGPVTTFTSDGTEGFFTVTAMATDGTDTVTATATVTVTSDAVLAEIVVAPQTATVEPGGAVQFTAAPRDQYGDPISAVVNWTVSGGGSLSPLTGLATTFTAGGAAGGPFTVTARSGSVTGTASVTVAAAGPGDFMLLAPDGTTEVDPAEAVVFTWGASADATSYHFQLARNEAFTDLVLNQPDLTATTVTLLGGQLRLGKTYRWRVTARNDSGTTAASNAPVVFETTPPAGDYNLMGCGPDRNAGGSLGGKAGALAGSLVILAILIPAALAAGGWRRKRPSRRP